MIVQIPGDILTTLFHHLAETGGWPVSTSVRMSINKGELIDYSVNGSAIDDNTIYKVAMPDYIANGGDGFKELIPLSRAQSGILVRDILIEHVIELTKSGKDIDAAIEGRVINVK